LKSISLEIEIKPNRDPILHSTLITMAHFSKNKSKINLLDT
jgi:hypothetical protein